MGILHQHMYFPVAAIHVFRPIHPEGSELPNIVPTQMPTPVRNSRPPLLATPPGFPSQLMQTKARSETGTCTCTSVTCLCTCT